MDRNRRARARPFQSVPGYLPTSRRPAPSRQVTATIAGWRMTSGSLVRARDGGHEPDRNPASEKAPPGHRALGTLEHASARSRSRVMAGTIALITARRIVPGMMARTTPRGRYARAAAGVGVHHVLGQLSRCLFGVVVAASRALVDLANRLGDWLTISVAMRRP